MMPLNARLLLSAYAAGIFPMAEDRDSAVVHWIEPRERGVLPLDQFHVPRRLRRTFRQQPFELTVDTDFDAVIRACADATPGRPRTWLNDDLIALYNDLHELGHAHSVECRVARTARRRPLRVRCAARFSARVCFRAGATPARLRSSSSWRGCASVATASSMLSSSPRIWSSSARPRCRDKSTGTRCRRP